MPLDDQITPFYRPAASSEPEPKGEWVRATCPKTTPFKPPSWLSRKEMVGGRCDYVGPGGNLCHHWRARDSNACPCHVEAYEGPDSTAGLRFKRKRKKKRRIVAMIEAEPSS